VQDASNTVVSPFESEPTEAKESQKDNKLKEGNSFLLKFEFLALKLMIFLLFVFLRGSNQFC
jgi:hypothetical protein